MKKILLFAGVSTGLFFSTIGSLHSANYSPVDCSSQPFFSENTCDLCYEETQRIVPGMQLTGLFDTWITTNAELQIVYEDEQNLRPVMINLGGSGTAWSYSKENPMDMWEWTPEVIWTPTGKDNRNIARLSEGKLMKFVQQKDGTTIRLDKTNREVGEFIGMMKFPLVYRDINPTTGTESDKIYHYECATYRSDVPKQDTVQQVIVPTTPAPIEAIVVPPSQKMVESAPTVDTPTPTQITSTKTGPELWIISVLALIATSLILTLNKKKYN